MKGSEDAELQSKIEYVPSKFTVHKFIEEIGEKKIVYQIIKMLDSLLIYINDKDHIQFNDLSLAMQNRYDGLSVGTRLMGNFTDEISKNIACRLSKKVNKAVFLSCNLDPDRLLMPLLEKRLYEEAKRYPDKF